MFVIDRTRGGTDEIPEETIDMAGTTGNIYSITINQVPSCTCPDNQKGNQCKHIVYVSPTPPSNPPISPQLTPPSPPRSSTTSSKPPHTCNTNSPSSPPNSAPYSPLPPPLPPRPQPQPPQTPLPTAKKSPATVRSALRNSSPRARRSFGVRLRAGIISIGLVLNSGRKVRRGRRFVAFIGMLAFS